MLTIQEEKCTLCGKCITACPFNALENNNGIIEINAACKLCGLCVKKCPTKAISLVSDFSSKEDLSSWRDILIFAQTQDSAIHPVTYELIGKAMDLTSKNGQRVHCVLIGNNVSELAGLLQGYGLNKILIYDDAAYNIFTADVFADAFADAINTLRPSAVLVGATAVGRSLAPRVSTRFRTGLTADCTALEMRKNGDLVQIRPAFGGDIMAQILTPNTRPQFASVRYKTMDRAPFLNDKSGELIFCDFQASTSKIKVLKQIRKENTINISDAEIIVAVGRAFKNKKDLNLAQEIADSLGGQLAGTRPLVEAGWLPQQTQIGLSGRTVKPRLIITLGISGAVQFTAAMCEAEYIISVNNDKNAPIFNIAHLGIVGDIYEVAPRLTALLMKVKQ